MKQILILGIGSPFGPDTLGWIAIERLRPALSDRRYPAGLVRTEICDRPGALLLAKMKGARAAILIDAMRSGRPSGEIARLDPAALPAASSGVSNHAFGVAEALALGRVLGELPERLRVYGIEAGEHAPPISEWNRLLRMVEEDLHGFR